jgi:hypothetical protein
MGLLNDSDSIPAFNRALKLSKMGVRDAGFPAGPARQEMRTMRSDTDVSASVSDMPQAA